MNAVLNFAEPIRNNSNGAEIGFVEACRLAKLRRRTHRNDQHRLIAEEVIKSEQEKGRSSVWRSR